MNDENTRVLGRTLAVEEMKDVSGAAKTSPTFDLMTGPRIDSTYQDDSGIDFDNPHL